MQKTKLFREFLGLMWSAWLLKQKKTPDILQSYTYEIIRKEDLY